MLKLANWSQNEIERFKQSEELECVVNTTCEDLFVVIHKINNLEEVWASIILIYKSTSWELSGVLHKPKLWTNPSQRLFLDDPDPFINDPSHTVIWEVYPSIYFDKYSRHVWLEISQDCSWVWFWQFLFGLYEQLNWSIFHEISHNIWKIKFLIRNWFKPCFIELASSLCDNSGLSTKLISIGDNERLIYFISNVLMKIEDRNNFNNIHEWTLWLFFQFFRYDDSFLKQLQNRTWDRDLSSFDFWSKQISSSTFSKLILSSDVISLFNLINEYVDAQRFY